MLRKKITIVYGCTHKDCVSVKGEMWVMARKILILGASYGSLLGMKLAMAGHDADLICRAPTAEVFNRDGAVVRLKLRDEDDPCPQSV